MPESSPSRRPGVPAGSERIQVSLSFGSDVLEVRHVAASGAAWSVPPGVAVGAGAGPRLLGFTGGQPVVRVPQGARATLLTAGAPPRPAGGEVPLGPTDLLLLEAGRVRVTFRRVPGAARVRTPLAERVDWAFAGVMLALLAISLFVGLAARRLPPPAQRTGWGEPRGAVLFLDERPRAPSVRTDPAGDAGAGKAATRPAPRARATRMARRGGEAGPAPRLLADLSGLDALFGPGATDRVATALDHLIGPAGASGARAGIPGGRGPGGGGGGGERTGWGGDDVVGGPGGPERGRGPGFGEGEKPKDRVPDGVTREPILVGPIERSEIDRVVKAHLRELRHCYQRQLQLQPQLAGKVAVRFVIGADGTVSSASPAVSTLGSPAVDACLTERFLRMRFPAPRGGGVVSVNYPLLFRAAGR